jgi:hypothetical protein
MPPRRKTPITPEEIKARKALYFQRAYAKQTQEETDRINARRRARYASLSPEEKANFLKQRSGEQKVSYAKNADKMRERSREWHRKHGKHFADLSEIERIKRLVSAIAIAARKRGFMACKTPPKEILKSQTGHCGNPGCNAVDSPESRLHLDHDHQTGEFRGWLCCACNFALGCLRDDPKRIDGLMSYLSTMEENSNERTQ